MRSTQRVTRGFSMGGDDETGEKKAPRRVRTRQQIMSGEGKRPPAKVELKLLAGNPFNPRDELTEIEETAESLRAKGQNSPSRWYGVRPSWAPTPARKASSARKLSTSFSTATGVWRLPSSRALPS